MSLNNNWPMGLAPEKASRIKARDTQTTWPDPWSIQPGVVWELIASYQNACNYLVGAYRMDLGSELV